MDIQNISNLRFRELTYSFYWIPNKEEYRVDGWLELGALERGKSKWVIYAKGPLRRALFSDGRPVHYQERRRSVAFRIDDGSV